MLLKEIDLAFEEAGKKDDWLYTQYKNFYELNQLSHFQIFELNWFPGAAKIMKLVDQLHSLVTPKHDFIEMAKLLKLQVNSRMTKEELVEVVKSHPSWRSKSFELEKVQRFNIRKRTLKPLYDYLAKLGYKTELLPIQVSYGKWMIDATNESGVPETIYLNESPEGDAMLIQSTFNDYIGFVEGTKNLFVQHV